jgi:hypothetical protein
VLALLQEDKGCQGHVTRSHRRVSSRERCGTGFTGWSERFEASEGNEVLRY